MRLFNLFLLLIIVLTLTAVTMSLRIDKGDVGLQGRSKATATAIKDEENTPLLRLEAKLMHLPTKVPVFPYYDLKDKLRLDSIDSRPDVQKSDRKLHLQILPSRSVIDIGKGDRVYLEYGEDEQLKIGDQSSPLWLEVYQNHKGDILCRGGLNLSNEHEGEALGTETWEFSLDRDQERNSPISDGLLKPLQDSKWWGSDRLIDLYGGSRYEKIKKCQRIETSLSSGGHILYVRKGDTLIFDGNSLVKKNLGQETKGFPLYLLRSVSSEKLCWDVWDEKGVHQGVFEQLKERVSPIATVPKSLFSNIRSRSRNIVTCRVDNKMVVLKKGDWLLKTGAGWRCLTSLEEVTSLVAFDLKGELFVFDGVKRKGSGQVFVGTLFDSSRSESLSVSISLSKGSSKEHSSHTKKTVSPTLPTSEEEETDEMSKERRPQKAYRLEEEAEQSSGY